MLLSSTVGYSYTLLYEVLVLQNLRSLFSINHLLAGFTAVLIGYASSVIIIIQAASAAGASTELITHWMFALGLVMGVSSIALSWFYKQPVLTAWSTPGAAMLILILGDYTVTTALGAFVVTGLMIMATGFIKPIVSALERVPPALAAAMLGAIVLPFCVDAFAMLATESVVFIAMLIAYIATKRLAPKYTMLALVVVGISSAIIAGAFDSTSLNLSISSAKWLTPEFDLMAILNISLPLYLVSMLSQNLPGISMIKSFGYQPSVKPILTSTGAATAGFAPFGVFAVNLAAISAALVLNEDVDKNKDKRYLAAIWAGVFYIIAGLWAPLVVDIFVALPSYVGVILAGFALLGTLVMCLQTAFQTEADREAALFTFVITLSGVTFIGLNATLIGLLIGLLYKRLFK